MLILRPNSNQYRYNSVLLPIRRDNPFMILYHQPTSKFHKILRLVYDSQFQSHKSEVRYSKYFDSCIICCLVFEKLSTVRQNKGMFIQYFTITVGRFSIGTTFKINACIKAIKMIFEEFFKVNKVIKTIFNVQIHEVVKLTVTMSPVGVTCNCFV